MSNPYEIPAPERGRDKKPRSRFERMVESPEYKRARLRDLTGIEEEQKLFDIFYELRRLFSTIGIENITYRKNTVDGRGGIENELVFSKLNSEELVEIELVLRELRVFGFPEPAPGTNLSNLVIENKRDLEVLRLLSVFSDLERAYEEREKAQKIQQEAEAYAEEIRLLEEEKLAFLMKDARRVAEMRMREEIEKAKRALRFALEEKWEKEKQDFREKRAQKKQRLDTLVDETLAKIQPQEIDLDFEIDNLEGPFEEVIKFRGSQPQLRREKKKIRKAEGDFNVGAFLEEVDPIEIDERLGVYTELWDSGKIADLEEEPIMLPGSRVNLGIFPKKFVWRFDKKLGRKRCFEYNASTKQIGREVTKEMRGEYFEKLHEVRQGRHELEKDQKIRFPKTREERSLEEAALLLVNNLIVWLINDLTSGLRGNAVLRKIKENNADDLYQNAVMGMLYAIDHHDQEKMVNGSGNIPYLLACMEGYIRRTHHMAKGLNDQSNQVRIPQHVLDTKRKIQKTERKLRAQYSSETDEYKMEVRLAEALSRPELGILRAGSTVGTLNKLRKKLLSTYREVGLDVLDAEDVDYTTQVSMDGVDLYLKPSDGENGDYLRLKNSIMSLLSSLTPREERILRMRFGIGSEECADKGDLTLEETGELFDVSRERIRQIEAKALRKLKHPSRSRRLLPHLD